MSPALNGSSAIRRFEGSDAIEIRDGITFDFYTGLPHVQQVLRICIAFLCGHVVELRICTYSCFHVFMSELRYNFFSQAASETYTEDQHTLELEGLEDSGHLVLYKSTLFKNPFPIPRVSVVYCALFCPFYSREEMMYGGNELAFTYMHCFRALQVHYDCILDDSLTSFLA